MCKFDAKVMTLILLILSLGFCQFYCFHEMSPMQNRSRKIVIENQICPRTNISKVCGNPDKGVYMGLVIEMCHINYLFPCLWLR